MNVWQRYHDTLSYWTDIHAHLPRLFEAARGRVVELGVRGGNSTSALLAGVETAGGELWSIDINPDCAGLFAGHPQWHFVCCDSEDTAAAFFSGLHPPINMLLIDTVHTYEKTLAELTVWMPYMTRPGRIFLHDTDDGSTYPGVRRALYDFCGNRFLYWLYPGSNGLGEIEC